MKFWVFMVVALLINGSLLGQEDIMPYRLRVPTATEYLAAVPEIAQQMEGEDTSEHTQHIGALASTFIHEIVLRYPDLPVVPFDVLLDAEPFIPRDLYTTALSAKSETGWHILALKAWLRENTPDLSTQTIWELRNYSLAVIPADFNGDSVQELATTFIYQPGDHPIYTRYMILQRDSALPEGYRIVAPDRFWYSAYCSVHAGCGGGAEIWGIEDVNADGLPEWMMSSGSCSYGHCGVGLHILGWRSGEMVELTQPDYPFHEYASGGGGATTSPAEGTWDFRNIDDDPAQELVQRNAITDNRNCTRVETRVFDWSPTEDRYIAGDIRTEYADSAGCALRLAHIAMKESDYEAAIREYERLLDLLPASGDDYVHEVRQYAQVRLAAAYALVGDEESAMALLEDLRGQTLTSPIMEEFILAADQAYSNTHNAIDLCLALHETIRGGCPSYCFSDFPESHIWGYGQINDFSVPMTYNGGDFGASNTGCNVDVLLERFLESLSLDVNRDPLEAITAGGWEIVEQFQSDLNDDGIVDWIFWTTVPNQAIVLLSEGNQYHASSMPIRMPTQQTVVANYPLPDDAGTGVVRLSFDDPLDCPSMECCAGRANVWRLENGVFRHAGSSMMCEERELEEVFPGAGQMIGWTRQADGSYGEVAFLWDAEEKTYAAPVTPVQTAETVTRTCHNAPYSLCGFEAEGTEALTALNLLMENPPEDSAPQFQAAVHYYRALTLEALDRSDEALAEYVALYESAPESAWGMLAALHLEPVGE